MTKKIIAIIPARGGSKGIPRKNIQPLGGKPLIAWSILAALKTQSISRVIVSTDDDEIAEISMKWGAEVPFLRPAEMAGDNVSIDGAINHLVEHLCWKENYFPLGHLLLYPTHPFRKKIMLTEAVNAIQDDNCTKFITVKPLHTPWHKFVIKKENTLIPIQGFPAQVNQSFSYRPYPLVFAQRYTGGIDKTINVWPIKDPACLVDIDTWQDLRMAELILQKGIYEPDF